MGLMNIPITGLGEPGEVIRGPGVDAHGNTIKNIPTPRGGAQLFKPTPTDAYTMLVGWSFQPANPYLLSSDDEAADILLDLKKNCEGFPVDVVVRDAPDLYPGPLFYGKDGRKLWTIEFMMKQPRQATPQSTTQEYDVRRISEAVGMLIFQRAQYPDYKWRISFEQNGIERNPTTGHV